MTHKNKSYQNCGIHNVAPNSKKFRGVSMDSCLNKIPVIYINQYRVYGTTFRLKYSIRPKNGREVRGIGGIWKDMGDSRVTITFKDLGIIIEIALLILPEHITTLFSMVDNHLDIYIQGKYVKYGNTKQTLR